MVRQRLLLASSSQLLLNGIRQALADSRELQIVGEAYDPAELLVHARRAHPDVGLLDAAMFNGDVARSVGELGRVSRGIRVVLMGDVRQADGIRAARTAGAAGCVPRDVEPTLLKAALWVAVAGGGWDEYQEGRAGVLPLTECEHLIVARVASGRSNKQIAHELQLAEHTVKFHLHRVYRKLGVANRTELVRLTALHAGLSLR